MNYEFYDSASAEDKLVWTIPGVSILRYKRVKTILQL